MEKNNAEIEKRILEATTDFMNVYLEKIREYDIAIEDIHNRNPEELKEYLQKSVPKLNLIQKIINNQNIRLAKTSRDDKKYRQLFEHVQKQKTALASIMSIMSVLLATPADKLCKAYRLYDIQLAKNKKIINEEGALALKFFNESLKK